VRSPRIDNVTGRSKAFAIGCVLGLIDGFLLLVIPPVSAILVLLIVFAPPRPAVGAGVFIGLAVGMSVPLWIESTRCAADSSCTGADIGGWLIASLVSLALGLLLAVFAGRRSRTTTK
jgi:hypothetical protein